MRNYIALAVPFFFVLIGLELAVARAKGRSVYRFVDAVTDLSCGITSQIALVFYGAAQATIYALLYEHRVVSLPPWAAWALAFVGIDFLYYWWHRLSHEVNFLWAAHVVHHQSEDYNLAVALRQAVATSWTVLPFFLPLAVLGVPTIVFATIYSFSTLYQFWIHTQLVGKIRNPIERVLNLPSHHRVHHAINPEYLDKNYGATLIVWDRLFGTYAEEIAPPVYGITTPIRSYNALWAQVHYWFELAAMSRAARGLDKVRVWLKSPAWQPGGRTAPSKSVSPGTYQKFERPVSRRVVVYVLAHYVLLVVATTTLMMFQATIPLPLAVAAGAAILGAVLSLGAIMERKSWAPAAEVMRLVVAAAAIVLWLRG